MKRSEIVPGKGYWLRRAAGAPEEPVTVVALVQGGVRCQWATGQVVVVACEALRPHRSRRGFAGMPQAQRVAMARKAGRAAAEKGAGHRFTPEEASRAARKAHVQRVMNRIERTEALMQRRRRKGVAHE